MAVRDVIEAGGGQRLPVGPDLIARFAAEHAVCSRPIVRQVTDRSTGAVERVLVACGSTRESVCEACATKAQRLRMQQCSEGWHLVDDPLDDDPLDDNPEKPDVQDSTDSDDCAAPDADDDAGAPSTRRVRSTRRRADAPDLPRVPMAARSVGRTFTSPTGHEYRPSMFITLTLDSYGRVVSGKPDQRVAGAGTPVRPERYDYRRAGVEAMHFPKLVERWVQHLRRCAGFLVQYFGAIEAQRRLAPHIHLAIRGAIPREVIRAVTAATYVQLWWPCFDDDRIVYDDHTPAEDLPRWDADLTAYVDPGTGVVLTTWEEALRAIDEDTDAEPAAVLRFGPQVDIKGIIAPSEDATRAVRYLTKYLTKNIAETYTGADEVEPDPAYEAHIDRLHHEVRYLPCSPECANWLRFGIQPKDAEPGLEPGWCTAKAHDREHLGLGGRRVQVSRHWSGKTLTEHRADRAAVVREVLAEAGITPPAADRMAADVLADDGLPRYVWKPGAIDTDEYTDLLAASVIETVRWRREYEAAKHKQAARIDEGGSRASPPLAASA